jgi:hypothetical protein
LEAFLAFHLSDDLDNEVEESCFVHQLAPIISAVCEEGLQPWPALADRIQVTDRGTKVAGQQGAQTLIIATLLIVERDQLIDGRVWLGRDLRKSFGSPKSGPAPKTSVDVTGLTANFDLDQLFWVTCM